jgi:uncharacterized damage-inducible protein DinB
VRRQDLETLFGFGYWIRDRVLEHAAKLTAAEFTVPSALTTRDLRGTLVHTLDVESSWRARLQREPEKIWKMELPVSDYPTVAALAYHWRRDETAMRAWLASLDDDTLVREFDLAPTTAMATPRERFPLWYYVLHIHTHTHQQLGDAAVLLTRMRQSPGNIEFLDYADQFMAGRVNRNASLPLVGSRPRTPRRK